MLLLCCLNCSALCFASVCGFCCSWDISWKRELWEYTVLSNTSAQEVVGAAGWEGHPPALTVLPPQWNETWWLMAMEPHKKPQKTHHNPQNILWTQLWQGRCSDSSTLDTPAALYDPNCNSGFILSQVQDPGWSHTDLASVPGLWSVYTVAAGAAFPRP